MPRRRRKRGGGTQGEQEENTKEIRREYEGIWLASRLYLALGSYWGGFGVALGCLSLGYQQALRWLWAALPHCMLDVRCWMLGVLHKHPEYDSPPPPRSEERHVGKEGRWRPPA